jgi:glycosyl transferase family 25
MDNLIIYYINLGKDIERNSKIKNVLDKLNIKYERIEGINGNDIHIEKKYTVLHTSEFPMTRGQYGCYLSHMKCYEKFIKSKYEYLIILEDDVILRDNFIESITSLFQNYNKLLKNIDFGINWLLIL